MKKNNSAVICLSHELDDIDDLSYDSESRLKLAAEIFGQFVLAEGEHIAETRANMLKSLQKKFRKARKTYVSPCTAHEYVVFSRFQSTLECKL